MKTLVDKDSDTYLEISLTKNIHLLCEIKQDKTDNLVNSFILDLVKMNNLFLLFHKSDEGLSSVIDDKVFITDKEYLAFYEINLTAKSQFYYKIKIILEGGIYFYLIDKDLKKFLSNPIEANIPDFLK